MWFILWEVRVGAVYGLEGVCRDKKEERGGGGVLSSLEGQREERGEAMFCPTRLATLFDKYMVMGRGVRVDSSP